MRLVPLLNVQNSVLQFCPDMDFDRVGPTGVERFDGPQCGNSQFLIDIVAVQMQCKQQQPMTVHCPVDQFHILYKDVISSNGIHVDAPSLNGQGKAWKGLALQLL